MGTYYVDNDVGATGGSGTQQDPYGIETAIAAAQPGDVFYWRGGGEGDVSLGHTLNFNKGGTSAAPVRWIGTDDDWVPIPPGQMPTTGVDGNDGAFSLIQISAGHQILENIRIHNTLDGRHGGNRGCYVTTGHVMVRNCVAHDCGMGFALYSKSQLFIQCRAYDVGFGFESTQLNGVGPICCACTVNDTNSHAFMIWAGGSITNCQAYDIGGSAVELYRDAFIALAPIPLLVDRLSVYDCVDGVKINAYQDNSANVFMVTNCIFDTCSGYGVNVTTPAGQLGFVANNGSRNCSSGQITSDRPGVISEGWIALPASPFVDAANGDLNLIRSTPARGAALDGGDLGALQRPFARLPYPVRGLT